MKELTVRWGKREDGEEIARILELDSLPGFPAFEERFVVMEGRGEILAVARCRTTRKRLLLDRLVADPRVGDSKSAVALYSGAGDLALAAGLREVWADSDEHRKYLLDTGYIRLVGGWRLDPLRPFGEHEEMPEGGWRRMLSLWSVTGIPFFRAFGWGHADQKGGLHAKDH